jgi:hypothetical protein
MNTLKILFTSFFLLNMSILLAQDTDKEDSVAASPRTADNLTQIMRVKRTYTLGDGITLRAPGTRIQITQSLQLQTTVNTYDNFSNTNAMFNIRRARFAVNGYLFNNKVDFRVRLNLPNNFQSTTSGNRAYNSVFQEGYVEYNFNKDHSIMFGLKAELVDSRELRIEGESLGFVDRSAASNAFDQNFDYGIRYLGEFKLGGVKLLRPFLSFTTGEGNASLQQNFKGFKYGVRLDFLPFGKFSDGGEYYMDDLAHESRPKLVAGVVYSYNSGISSATGSLGGRYLYGDANKNIVLPTYSRFIFDYMFKYKGFYSLGSYSATSATVPGSIAGEFKLNGNFTQYTGQTTDQIKATVLGRLNLGAAFNFQAGYTLRNNWAFAGRYSVLNDNVLSANFASYNRNYTVIATKYLSEHNLKIQSEIGYQELKKNLQTGNQKGNLYAQVMFTVQL